MRVITVSATLTAFLALVVLATGCAEQGTPGGAPVDISGPPPGDGHDHAGHDHDDHDGHDHGDHAGHDHENEHQGPHGGHVIELGRNHEYHAELVENEQGAAVTVYILDKDLKELAIDQSSIVMNLVVDGKAKSFDLAAAGGSEGQASRFDATGKELFEALHEHEASGKLRVTINGSPYSGEVEHHHHHGEDDDHGHDHGDHKH